MITRSRRVPLVAALVAGAGLFVSAATPGFWQVASLADFLKGELNGLAIDADGRLTLGPAVRMIADTTAPMVWQLAVTDDGTLLAGTGNDGKVYRVASNGTLTTAFDSNELQVHALAPAQDGGFYAGTSPEGKVYRVARDGSSKEVFDPEDKYIWAIATAPDGALFVATGEKGVIYRIDSDGRATPFYRTRATNVTALAVDAKGNLLAGTSSPGQVLRIDPQARGFVLVDSPYSEMRALRLDQRGNIYAVAISGGVQEPRPADRPTTAEPTGTPVPSVSTEITITAIGDVSTSSSPSTPAAPRSEGRRDPSRGAIYRISPDGLWETFWEATEDIPFDVAVERTGDLLVATGHKGRLLRLSGDPVRVTVVARAEAQQVTSLTRDRQGRIHYATANPGKIFDLGSSFVTQGTYESDVRDATNVASWGLIRWRASTPDATAVQLSTRTGNTRNPDETWSPWSAPYKVAEGQAISSPKARYLQWRAVLSGTERTPVLSSVTVAYLPRNTRPSIASITVHPPGVSFARPFPTGDPEIAGYENGTADARPPQPPSVTSSGSSGPALGRRMYQKGLQTFVWKADDEPNDRLQYDVYYRRQGETTWVPLRRGLWDPILTWDTTSIPDATYTIKIVVSDAASNAPGTALSAERESEAFDVDNTAPDVEVGATDTTQGRTRVRFTVRDGHSPLERVEYSLDATRWRVVYPVDGIADSREERFEVTLESGVTLPVMIRAVDELNNVGTAVVTAAATGR
jgi:sugar lactone lactonase YvrE